MPHPTDPVQGQQGQAPTTTMAAYKALKALKEHPQWGEVQEMVADGIPAGVIARTLVQEWADAPARQDTLAQALELYARQEAAKRGDTVAGARQVHNASPPPAVSATAAQGSAPLAPLPAAVPDVDPLDRLNWLWQQQESRIRRTVETEASLAMTFPTTHKEITTGLSILAAIAELRMDRGIDRRALGKLEVEATANAEAMRHTHGPTVAEVVGSPKARQRVLSFVAKLDGVLARLSGHAARDIDVEPEPAGDAP